MRGSTKPVLLTFISVIVVLVVSTNATETSASSTMNKEALRPMASGLDEHSVVILWVSITSVLVLLLLLILVLSLCLYFSLKKTSLLREHDSTVNKVGKVNKHDSSSPHSYSEALTASDTSKLAPSVQRYHFALQQQKMIESEGEQSGGSTLGRKISTLSGDATSSDEDNLVYECPGLANANELEVKNPLFDEAEQKKQPKQGMASLQRSHSNRNQ